MRIELLNPLKKISSLKWSRRFLRFTPFLLFLLLFGYGGDQPVYVGSTLCRMCHLKEFISWKKTKHYLATDILPLEARNDHSCLKCHSTARGKYSGVQCEICHGPGSIYSSLKVKYNEELMVKFGPSKPDEKACRRCHNEGEPHFKPFNYYKAIKKVAHSIEKRDEKIK